MRASRASTRRSTVTSLAPLPRDTEKATIGSSNSRAKVRGSAAPSVTVPSSSSLTFRPPDRAGAGERADRLFLAGDLAAPAAEIDIVLADLIVDPRRGDAEREQFLRIE